MLDNGHLSNVRTFTSRNWLETVQFGGLLEDREKCQSKGWVVRKENANPVEACSLSSIALDVGVPGGLSLDFRRFIPAIVHGHSTTSPCVVNRTAYLGLFGPIVSGCGYAMPIDGRCTHESRHGVHGSFDDGYASRYEPNGCPE